MLFCWPAWQFVLATTKPILYKAVRDAPPKHVNMHEAGIARQKPRKEDTHKKQIAKLRKDYQRNVALGIFGEPSIKTEDALGKEDADEPSGATRGRSQKGQAPAPTAASSRTCSPLGDTTFDDAETEQQQQPSGDETIARGTKEESKSATHDEQKVGGQKSHQMWYKIATQQIWEVDP